MTKYFRISAFVALAALLALFLLYTDDEEKIRARLEELRVLTEVLSVESGVEQLTKARQIGRYFTGQTVFDLTNAGHGTTRIPTRQELVQRVMKARTRLSSLELALQDMQVSVDGDVATVRVQGSALGAIRGEQGQFLEIHTIEVMLEEVADTWLISGARHLRDERQHASVATPD
jgi:hypothetical protein